MEGCPPPTQAEFGMASIAAGILTAPSPIYKDLHSLCARNKIHLNFGVHSMATRRIPISILRRSCNILETLSNLLYLAEMEADDPQKVRTYLSLSKERLQAMTEMLVHGE
jgi:hypothetical protein